MGRLHLANPLCPGLSTLPYNFHFPKFELASFSLPSNSILTFRNSDAGGRSALILMLKIQRFVARRLRMRVVDSEKGWKLKCKSWRRLLTEGRDDFLMVSLERSRTGEGSEI